MSDRLTGIFTLIVALAYFVSATGLEQPFFADPLGPKAFPMLVAVIAMLAGLFLILKPGQAPAWPAWHSLYRLAFALLTLIIYALCLTPLGFLLPTALAATALSYQITPQFRRSLMVGPALSLGLFLIFKFGLGLSLFALPRWVWDISWFSGA